MYIVPIKAGSTSQSITVFIQDTRVGTGAGLTGLVFNTSGLTAKYSFTGANATSTSITLATLATPTTAWSSGGFKELDSTGMPGVYRLDLPDAAIAASKGRMVTVVLQGAANMAQTVVHLELTGWDSQDAVRGGMTALPNANAEAAGGLYTRGSGAGQITQSTNGQIDVDVKKINGVATTSVTTINANLGMTQPINFTGTGASALVKSDMVDIAGAAVSTSTAQLGVNVVNFGGSAGTFASGRPEVNTTHAAGTAWGSGAITAASIASSAITNAKFAAGAIDAAAIAADAIGASELATDAVTEIAAGVWDRLTSSLTTVGSAGKLIVDNLNATVSSRATQTSVDTIDDFVDTEVAAIKAKTDQLTFTTANQLDVQVLSMAANTLTASALAADAVTEIQSGLSTLTQANIRSAVGLASANLDTQLAALPTDASIATAVWGAGTRILTAGTNIVLAKGTGVTGFNDLSAANVRTAIGLATNDLDTQLGAIKTNVDAILVDTAEIGTAGAGLTNIPWNASWDAEVQSEVDDALVAYGVAKRTPIKKNVAFSNFMFYMMDDSTGAAATGLTITGEIAKDAGAFAALTNSASIVEVGNGVYAIDLTSSETNADNIILRFTATGAATSVRQIMPHT